LSAGGGQEGGRLIWGCRAPDQLKKFRGQEKKPKTLKAEKKASYGLYVCIEGGGGSQEEQLGVDRENWMKKSFKK